MASERKDTRVFAVKTGSTDEDLLDLFAFHVSREHITIKSLAAPAPEQESSDIFGFFDGGAGEPAPADQPQPAVPTAQQAGFGFFDGSPGAPQHTLVDPAVPVIDAGKAASKAAPAKAHPGNAAAQPEAATIRVAISKVDQLINLVGELVITQAMLAQNSRALDPAVYQQLLTGLADLDRNTRDLQESVMSIRMIPMSIVFSRFPRMLRDL